MARDRLAAWGARIASACAWTTLLCSVGPSASPRAEDSVGASARRTEPDAASRRPRADASQSSRLAPLAARSLLLDGAWAGERAVAVGERGHVLLSDDGGEAWRQIVVPTDALLTSVAFADDRHGLVVGHDATILATSDGGETWTMRHRAPELEAPLLDVWMQSPERAIAVGAYGLILETRDGGASWTRRTIDDDDAHYNAILSDEPRRSLYLIGEYGTIRRSTDLGSTWSAVPSPYEGSFFGGAVASDGNVVLVGLRGHAFRYAPTDASFVGLPTGTSSALLTAVVCADGGTLLGGADGAVLVESSTRGRISLERRADRGTVAAVLLHHTRPPILLGSFGTDVGGAPGPDDSTPKEQARCRS